MTETEDDNQQDEYEYEYEYSDATPQKEEVLTYLHLISSHLKLF
jgi:hypothetical protein